MTSAGGRPERGTGYYAPGSTLTMPRRGGSGGEYDDVVGERLGLTYRRVGCRYGGELESSGGYDDGGEARDVVHREEVGGQRVELGEGGRVERSEVRSGKPPGVERRGVFYMHDNRSVGDGGRSYSRCYPKGRFSKPKDDEKWGHDKFEELQAQNAKGRGQGQFGNPGRADGNVRGKGKGPMRSGTTTGAGVKPRGEDKHSSKSIQRTFTNPPTVRTKNESSSKLVLRNELAQSLTVKNNSSKPPQRTFTNPPIVPTKNESSSEPLKITKGNESARTDPVSNHSSLTFGHGKREQTTSSFLTKKDELPNALFPRSNLANRGDSVTQKKELSNAVLHIADPLRQDKIYAHSFVPQADGNYLGNLRKMSSMSWPAQETQFPHNVAQRGLPSSTMLTQPIDRQTPVERTIQPALGGFTQWSCTGTLMTSQSLSQISHDLGAIESWPMFSEFDVAQSGKEINTLQDSERGFLLPTGMNYDQNLAAAASISPALQYRSQLTINLGNPSIDTMNRNPSQRTIAVRDSGIPWLPVSPAVSSAVGHSFYSTDLTAGAHNVRHLGRQFSSLSLTSDNAGINKSTNGNNPPPGFDVRGQQSWK